LNWLFKALSSSVGKKFVMAITGLSLCLFLVIHLSGNLLLYVGEETYNHYAEALHAQGMLLTVAEVGLLLLFAFHLLLAAVTNRENRSARPWGIAYNRKQSKQSGAVDGSAFSPSLWMLATGLVVLVFLLLHLADLRFELRPVLDYEGKTPYAKAVAVLTNPLSYCVYFAGSLFLGVHLAHGFSSAFQSLGINHPKWNGLIRWFGILFAIVIAVGFASFAVVWGFASLFSTK
jgi:succinate dehydrogenase / fumarate reductase cytochrome b subunit